LADRFCRPSLDAIAAIDAAFAEASLNDRKVEWAHETAVEQQSSVAPDGDHGERPGEAAETDPLALPMVRDFASPGELAANPKSVAY
jgi:hypothetical protein